MNRKTEDALFAATAGGLFYGLVILLATRYVIGVSDWGPDALCAGLAAVIGAVASAWSVSRK